MTRIKLPNPRLVLTTTLLLVAGLASGCIQQEMDLTDEAQIIVGQAASTTPTVITATATEPPTATQLPTQTATITAELSATATATATRTARPSPTPTVTPTATSTLMDTPLPLPTNTATAALQSTSIATPSPAATSPPVTGSSAIPIDYFNNNPDWDALVACAANFGSEVSISPDGFHNIAGPFDRYEEGVVYFQGTGESNALNGQSVAGIRYVTQGDPLFRYEPSHFGQLPWSAETVISALQPGDWIVVGGQSGYLSVACHAYPP